MSRVRHLKEIALEIRQTWPNVYFGAEPYLEAMGTLYTVSDNFLHETGRSIVVRFLGQAQGWRGADARRIKAELKSMLNQNFLRNL